MRFRLSLLVLPVLLSIPCAAQLSPKESFVVTDKEAFGLMPASLVAAPVVRQLEWSPDGQYVLAVRESMRIRPDDIRRMMQSGARNEPPPGEVQLLVWNAKSQTSQVAWRAEMGATVEAIHWLPRSDTVFITIHRVERPDPAKPPEQKRILAKVSLSQATVRPVAEIPEGMWVTVHTSPTQPIALAHKISESSTIVTLPDGSKKAVSPVSEVYSLRSNGAIGNPIALPGEGVPERPFSINRVEWSKDGYTAYLGSVDRQATAAYNKTSTKRKVIWKWLSLNPVSGRVQSLASDPDTWQSVPQKSLLQLSTTSTTAGAGAPKRPIPILWMEVSEPSLFPRAMVAVGATKSALSATSEGILYEMHGAAWVTPILRIDRDMFDTALRAAERMEALSKGKQLGLAALMYAADYDEVLPGAEGVGDKLLPYMQNGDLLNGFTYTYGGGPLSGIASPSATELGYVSGPGGRAVIYADGHVVWRDN